MTAPVPPSDDRECPQLRAAAGDGDRAVLVRAQHHRPRGPQPGERTRRGVSVPVARADRDDRETRPDPVVEAGVLVGAAVVGDLEDIDRPELLMVPQQFLLGVRFEVAQQEEGQSGGPHQQGHARIVGPFGRRSPGRRPQHLPLQRPGPAPLAGRRGDDGNPCGRRGPPHELRLPRRLFQRGDLHHSHRAPPQHPRQPSHVVDVEMRQQEQRHPLHAQFPQAGVHRSGLGARVHHHGRARSDGEDGGVPLPDRALHIAPAGRRPPFDRTSDQRRPQYGEEQCHGQGGGKPSPEPEPPAERHHRQGGRGEQQPSAHPAGPPQLRPGQSRPAPGDRRDPPGRHPRAPGQQLRHRPAQRGRRQRGEPQDRRGARRQLGQHIAGDRHQAHPGRQHGDDRGADRLRGRGGRQRLGRARPHPAASQGLAPPGRQGQQGSGGQDREEESVAAGQPRVVEHQQQYGGGQRRDQGSAPPGGDGQQGHRPAGRRPQHAGLRPAHHHERQGQARSAQGRRPQGEPQAWRQTTPLRQLCAGRGSDEEEEHHGQVGAGDGQQVQQIGGPERLVQIGLHPGGVPDHQSRQQGSGIGRQIVGDLAQPGPQPPGDPLHGVRAARHPRWRVPGRPEQGDGPLAVPGRRQPGDHGDPGRGLQPGPVRMPRQYPHGGGHPGPGTVRPGHPGHHRVEHHHRWPAPAAGGPGIRAHGELRQHPGVLPGQPRHRPGSRLGPLEPGHRGPGGRAEQGRRHGRPGLPGRPPAPAPGRHQQPGGAHPQPRRPGAPPEG